MKFYVVALSPFYFKPFRDRLYRHFSLIAEKVDLPAIVYNTPSLTGINIPVDLYVELAKEHSNVVGAKITFDNFSYLRRLVFEVKSIRKDFSIFTGCDDMVLPALILGCDGVIPALGNVYPKIFVNLYNSWISGDIDNALKLYSIVLKISRIYDYISSIPTGIKMCLHILGAPVKPISREPLGVESEDVKKRLTEILSSIQL